MTALQSDDENDYTLKAFAMTAPQRRIAPETRGFPAVNNEKIPPAGGERGHDE
jgi:hypothetical protein